MLFEVLNLGLRVGKPFQLRDFAAITLAVGGHANGTSIPKSTDSLYLPNDQSVQRE